MDRFGRFPGAMEQLPMPGAVTALGVFHWATCGISAARYLFHWCDYHGRQQASTGRAISGLIG